MAKRDIARDRNIGERRQVRETTARIYDVSGDVGHFAWDSTEPEFNNPGHPDFFPPLRVVDGTDIDTGDAITVAAIVTAVFRRL